MAFNTSTVLFLYLPLVLILFFIIHRLIPRGEKLFLLCVSLVFYLRNGLKTFFLLIAVILSGYIFAFLISRCGRIKTRKLLLAAAVTLNIGILSAFKFSSLPQTAFDMIMPVGISFYIFQNVSYLIDVYRGEAVADNLLDYGLYMSFFPKMMSGPIVCFGQMRPRLKERTITKNGVMRGFERFLIGLCKKVVLADVLGELAVKNTVPSHSFLTLWLSGLAYVFQLYYDLSGYADMAIGIGNIFGFDLPENFVYPLTARTFTEFWHRWHITLSQWFRDYVYIPLGGSRKGVSRQIFNMLIVWLLTGIWHGTGSNYIGWGLYCFVFLALERYVIHPEKIRSGAFRFIYRIITMILVICMCSIFHASNIGIGLRVVKGMLNPFGRKFADTIALFSLREYFWYFIAAGILAIPIPAQWKDRHQKLFACMRYGFLLVGVLLAIAAIIVETYNPYLYELY